MAIVLDDAPWVYIGMSSIINQDGDVREHIECALYSVLSSVQDFVIEFVTQQGWPSSPQHPSGNGQLLPLPSVSVEDHRVQYGYGSEAGVALAFESIDARAFLVAHK